MQRPYIIFFLFLVTIATSQVNKREDLFWFDFSSGVASSPKKNILTTVGAGLNYMSKGHCLRMKYYNSFNDPIDTARSESAFPNRLISINSLQLQYGRRIWLTKKIFATGYCGIGVSKGLFRGPVDRIVYLQRSGSAPFGPFPPKAYYYYSYKPFTTLSVPADINLVFSFTRIVSVGIDLYANFSRHSDLGFSLNLSFGKIRSSLKKTS